MSGPPWGCYMIIIENFSEVTFFVENKTARIPCFHMGCFIEDFIYYHKSMLWSKFKGLLVFTGRMVTTLIHLL